jgi:uncharacterized protein YdhG (YjbR/CyaY superfamily)
MSAKNETGFSDFEREAMKERARELKMEERLAKDRALGETEVQAEIAKMSEPDRSIALRLHAIIQENAPNLAPRLWYGMPAYARDGKVVCFFQTALKFKARYATLGFNDSAKLDEGEMWPTAFALTKLTSEVEARVTALVKKAAG